MPQLIVNRSVPRLLAVGFLGMSLLAGCKDSPTSPDGTPNGPKGLPVGLPAQFQMVTPETEAFVHVRLAELLASPMGRSLHDQVLKQAPNMHEEIERSLGMKPAELDSVTVLVLGIPWRLHEIEQGFIRPGPIPPAPTAPAPRFPEKEDVKPGVPREDPRLPRELPPDTYLPSELPPEKFDPRRDHMHEHGPPVREPVLILTTAKPYARETLLAKLEEPKEEKIKGKSLYVSMGSYKAVYFADDRTVVTGPPAALKRLLDPPKPPAATWKHPLAPALTVAAEKHHLVAGFTPAALNLGDSLGDSRHVLEAHSPSWMRGLRALFDIQAAALCLDVGETTEAKLLLAMPDEKKAERMKKLAKIGFDYAALLMEEFGDDLATQMKDAPQVLELWKQLHGAVAAPELTRQGYNVQVTVRARIDPAKFDAALAEGAARMQAAANRIQAANNLRQMGIALYNYHNDHGMFPPYGVGGTGVGQPNPLDPKGKPNLSWRVLLLPYVECGDLYNQFRFDQPWDSAHNIKLLDKMPKVYALPGAKADKGMTYFRGFIGTNQQDGRHVPFFGTPMHNRLRIHDIKDGTANTLMLVEAAEPLLWTKPEELIFDPKKPLPKLGGHFADGFHILMCDGEVRFVKNTIKPETLRVLIGMSDGEVLMDDPALDGPSDFGIRRGFGPFEGPGLEVERRMREMELRRYEAEMREQERRRIIEEERRREEKKPELPPDKIRGEPPPDAPPPLAVPAPPELGVPAEVKQINERRKSQINLQHLGIAMHNYHNDFNRFPPPAIGSKDGKPLLSWRVALLPYLEQNDLYKQFKLDEPWDGEHNKKLLEKMPKLYAPLGVETKDKHVTFYQVFTGPGTVFEDPKGVPIREIRDGTANTILIVEAGEPVPWTKPDDLVLDPKKPVPKLGGLFKGDFHICLGDGSVHFIKKETEEKALRAAITRNDAIRIEIGNDGVIRLPK